MSELLVYRASAGSGKTFRLAVEYIKRLIQSPISYRNILAVTFTNKATGEMKERILSQLYGIAINDKDSQDYLNVISDELQLSPDVVREKSAEALGRLIHDYSRFQVNTIDSFFQTVLRNLARELGLGAGMNIELDIVSALNEAVDKIVNKLDAKSPVFFSLFEYIKELIAEDKNWNVIESIKKFGGNIFNEEFMEQRIPLHDKLKQPKFFEDYRTTLRQIEKKADEQIQEVVTEFFRLLDAGGIEPDELKGGKNGIASYFRKLQKKEYLNKIRNKTVEKSLSGPDEWGLAKNSKATMSEQMAAQLHALLDRAEKLRQKNAKIIYSCQLASEYLYKIALLATIDDKVHEMNAETNRFLLAETNILLRNLMMEGDSSFVFEKIGANIQHVMIDEFQDTSHLQWKNFRMLLVEGLSQGGDSLIVGDVKQAIYRWRSGDWSILGGLSGKLGAFPVRNETLKVNRRSEQQIIDFNNKFFTSAIEILDNRYKEEQGESCLPLLNAYSDVEQIFPENKEKGKGYVKVSFLNGQKSADYNDYTLKSLVNEVKELRNNGVTLNNIVILVRTNKYIPLIADYFAEHLPDCPIVSNEAFRLDASQALKILIEAVRYLANPDNRIALLNLIMLSHPLLVSQGVLSADSHWDWQEVNADNLENFLPEEFLQRQEELKQLSVYELLERLTMIFRLEKLQGQEAYLFPFFDAVLEYSKKEAGDLDSFLQYWDNQLYKKTVPTEEVEGIRIYTIHSSKGLEFHTVIMPFCHWKMENEKNPHLVWCTPRVAPFNELSLLPITYSKEMNESVFHDDFLRERLELWVDNLNVLYVGFTRATKNLIIMGKKEKNAGTVSQLLADALQMMSPGFTMDTPFECGTLCQTEKKERKEKSNVMLKRPTDLKVTYETFGGNKLQFRQSNSSVAFISGEADDERQEGYIQQGNLLHKVFSGIRTLNDVPRVLRHMELEGLFTPPLSAASVRKLIERALSNPEASKWFTNEWEVFNECSIVRQKNGQTETCRPDRVMKHLLRDEMVVVDFKFGTPRKTYDKQVKEYVLRLQEMGYKHVRGYLWYVYKNEVQEVNI